ncbi:MAG: dTDP-4-dehydrorhamnose reductase [Pseudomonadales bacterium]|nr:dTDP-4-dehydrorhamnose reductase [Pseudomonadales bacterium]
MKVLIVGANGQLGQELQITAGPNIEATALGRDQLDIGHQQQVDQVLAELKPQLVINAAAYTAVDKAEQESELAYQINRDGVVNLARASQKIQARLIHISTDFVFDGCQSNPYKPADTVNPLGCYGESKYAGEQALQSSGLNDYLIVRTAWVYSSFGTNFVKTMLRLMAEKDSLGVIADQVGTPTYARELARAIWKMAQQTELQGILHWTDAGVASWYDFAVAIQEEALELGLLTKPIPITPITTEAYPTPATRPAYSVLDKTESWDLLQCPAVHWRTRLRQMLNIMATAGTT